MFQVLKKIKSHYSKFALLFILLIVGVLIIPAIAKAGIAEAVGNAFRNTIVTVMRYITVYPLKGATAILNWVLEGGFLAKDIGYQPHNNEIIEAGWVPVRNFANMFFIIALVVIGIATAIQYKEYKAQKALPKLLIVALLINFTPALAAAVIDLSDAAMEAFLAEAGAGGFTTVKQTLPVSGTGKTANSISGYIQAYMAHLTTADVKIGPAIGEGFFLMLYGWGAAITFFMFALLFMARYVVLWLLIIVSPLAFISYVFPASREKIWDPWWEQFVNWTIIGIPAALTLLLSKEVLLKVHQMSGQSGLGGETVIENLINFIASFTLPLLFLIIGYLATLKVSAKGSEAVINAGKNIAKNAPRLAAKGAGWAGKKLMPARAKQRFAQMRESTSIEEEKERAEEKGEEPPEHTQWEKARSKVGSVIAPHAVRRRVGKALSEAVGTEEEEVENSKEEAKEESPVEKFEKIRRFKTTERSTRIGRLAKAIEQGELKALRKMGLSNDAIAQVASEAAEANPEEAKNIINSTPEIAKKVANKLNSEQREKVGLTLSDEEQDKYGNITAKAAGELDLDEIENLTKESFQNKDVQYGIHTGWSGRELGKAAQEHGRDFVEVYNEGAQKRGRKWYRKHNTGAANYLGNNSAQDLGFEEPSEEGEEGEIITPSPRAHRKKIGKPGQEEEQETGPRGRPELGGGTSQKEEGPPRGREEVGGGDASEQDNEPRGRPEV